ncbi:MAG: hypothetical protein Q4B70_13435 [Lachnospiraceae bacterium]|nr:hypothetical protein [Lachnospiraceae bacterium]
MNLDEYNALPLKIRQRRERALLKVIFELSEEESAAYDHQVPMTQEMFENLYNKFIDWEADVSFDRLVNEFPEQAKVYAEKIIKDIDMDNLPPISKETDRRMREGINQRIREIYGEDAEGLSMED